MCGVARDNQRGETITMRSKEPPSHLPHIPEPALDACFGTQLGRLTKESLESNVSACPSGKGGGLE